MNPTGNTILVTGGGSGIGRGLAEELQKQGNRVILAGRRRHVLEETAKANPGMSWMVLDIEHASGISSFVPELLAQFPKLNVVINNAGIMRPEQLADEPEASLETAEAIVATNLLGPIRMISALIPHFKQQPGATIVYVSSGLAFVPLAATPTYCATKAAIHSYSQSLRQQLKDTKIEVLEIIPPYVQTDLMGGAADPRAMPLKDFIAETMALLTKQPTPPEIAVERVNFLREAAKRGEYDAVFSTLNAQHFE